MSRILQFDPTIKKFLNSHTKKCYFLSYVSTVGKPKKNVGKPFEQLRKTVFSVLVCVVRSLFVYYSFTVRSLFVSVHFSFTARSFRSRTGAAVFAVGTLLCVNMCCVWLITYDVPTLYYVPRGSFDRSAQGMTMYAWVRHQKENSLNNM